MEIDEDCLKSVDMAWCVSEYCKQMNAPGVRLDGWSGVANFTSLLGNTLSKVELPYLGVVNGESQVDGELSRVNCLCPFTTEECLTDVFI